MGKYNGDPKSLPSREPVPGAVPFREPKDSKTLGIVASAPMGPVVCISSDAGELGTVGDSSCIFCPLCRTSSCMPCVSGKMYTCIRT